MIKRVGIVAKSRLTEAASHLVEIGRWLESRGVEAIYEADTAALAGVATARPALSKDELAAAVDLVVVLGGDGTLLGMAGRIAQAGVSIPILGVNFGGLGFLTEVTLPELYPTLDATLAGRARIDTRTMLRAAVKRGAGIIEDRIVLNDVVLTRGALSSIIDLSVWVGDEFVTRVRSDGLIVATPTGSTAYNLATGGPIIHPTTDAIVLTPVAPHTLTNRPLVVPAASAVRIQPRLDNAHDEVFAAFDGQRTQRLESGDEVRVSQAPHPLRLVRASTRGYFEVLREKLKWGER